MRRTIETKVRDLGPWFHQIDLGQGIRTRDIAPSEGPQPLDHPASRWATFEPHVPHDLTGQQVLDLGSADGFFSIELARRGARVTAVDASAPMIRRLEWAAKRVKLARRIRTQVGRVEDISMDHRFDVCFFLGVLYHLENPLLALQRISRITRRLYLESATHPGDEPCLLLKPPQEGVHRIPKWFPTRSCLEGMLAYVGFDRVRFLDEQTRNRASLIAEQTGV